MKMLKDYITRTFFDVGPAVQRENPHKDLSTKLHAATVSQWPQIRVLDMQALYALVKVPEQHLYCVDSTGDMYIPHDGVFMYFNPYRDQNFRPILEDESYVMPHGGELRSSLYYNIIALREDLRVIQKYSMDMATMLGNDAKRLIGYDLMTAWFMVNHTALADQVKQVIGADGLVDREIESAIAKLGVSITHHRARTNKFAEGSITFRSGDFVATM